MGCLINFDTLNLKMTNNNEYIVVFLSLKVLNSDNFFFFVSACKNRKSLLSTVKSMVVKV